MERTEQLLYALLRQALWGREQKGVHRPEAVIPVEILQDGYTPEEWEQMRLLADKNGVSAMVFESLGDTDAPGAVREKLQRAAFETAVRYYRMSRYTARVLAWFREAGIPVAVLKGLGLNALYPKEEMRKLSDLDLYVAEPGRFEAAEKLLEEKGHILLHHQIDDDHHVEYSYHDREQKCFLRLELHRTVSVRFDRPETDGRLEALFAPPLALETEQAMGLILPVLDTVKNALSLLLHMAGHLLSSGFSVRNLCDWAVFLKRYGEELSRSSFSQEVQSLGLSGFLAAVTACAVEYLGLDEAFLGGLPVPSKKLLEQLMGDMLEGGDLGTEDTSRVSSLVGGPGKVRLRAYLKQLNEETARHYPKLAHWYPLYPFLWLGVVRRTFLKKHGSVSEIAKTYRRRSRLCRSLGLFENGEK